MNLRVRLKHKVILFFVVYSLFLLGSVLCYFYLSGLRTIKRQATLEVTAFAGIFAELLGKELQDTITELVGLKSKVELYLTQSSKSSGFDATNLEPVKLFVIAYPYKYAEIAFCNRPANLALSISPARTLKEEIQPLLQNKKSGDYEHWFSTRAAQNDLAGVQITGPEYISGRDLVHLRIALQPDSSSFLYASVRLNDLIERVLAELQLPTACQLAVADSNGIILNARDVHLLQSYLTVLLPHLAASPVAYQQLTQGMKIQANLITRWQRLHRSNVILVLQKNISAELADWHSTILRVLIFVCFIFFTALLLIWFLVDRMALSLQRVTSVANRVATGDFSQKIEIERQDDLGILIHAFNDMIDKLRVSYQALHEINTQLAEKIAELTRTRQELSQKQRMALLGEAISKISHEVQNKIGGVSIWVQNLERHSSHDDTARLYIQELKQALKSSLDMLVNFKRFYREPQLQRQLVSAAELIAASIAQLSAALMAKQITIEKNGCDDLGSILADREQLVDALVNLLLNAIYFSPEKGVVQIDAERQPQWLVIAIFDQGPGIPVRDKEKLFQPFFTTKPGGSGLGLAIVNNIIKAHHGKLRCYNAGKDWGACFEIMLPVSDEVTA